VRTRFHTNKDWGLIVILKKQYVIYSCMFLFFLIGIYIRFLAVQYSVVDIPIRADASDYYSYAMNMHEWGVYSKENAAIEKPEPDALRSPGFPWFAYLFYSPNQDTFVKNVLIAQTFIQIISFLFLLGVLSKFYGATVALIAGWFLWTFPHFVNINIYFLSESLFTSLLTFSIGIAIWSHFSHQKKMFLYILFAFFLGITILVRPTLQYFPFFIFFVLFIYYRKVTRPAVVILIVSLIPMLLWGIHNLIIIGHWSDPTLTINGLYHGSFPWFMYNDNPASFGFPYRFDPQASEVYQGVGKTLEIIYERFSADPMNYLSWYLVGKQFFLWQWSIIAGQGDIFIYPTLASPYYGEKISLLTYSVNKCIHFAWLVIAFLGLAIIVKKILKKEKVAFSLVIISAILLYAILIHIIVAPFPRYGIPFKVPAIIVFAIVLSEIINWVKRKFASSFHV